MKIKVLALTYRPNWMPNRFTSSNKLIGQYVQEIREITNGRIEYDVIHHFTIDALPTLLTKEQYSAAYYLDVLNYIDPPITDPPNSNTLAMADYHQLTLPIKVIDSGKYDEVWLFGGPYFGFYESRMIGRNAEWCNSPPLIMDCRTFVVMGFSYERTIKEMLHNLGHRIESYLSQSEYGSDFSVWKMAYGTVHRVPGGENYSQDERIWLRNLPTVWFDESVMPENPAEPVNKTLFEKFVSLVVKLLRMIFDD